MDKKKKIIVIVAVVVALLAVVGTVVAVSMNNKDDDTTNQANQTPSDVASSNVDPSKEFNPQALNTLSYVSTTSTTVSGQTVESRTESDGRGTFKTSSSFGGTTTESYVTGNTVITCVDGECSKSTVDPASAESQSLVQSASQYKDSAVYSGSEACGDQTCQVWKANGAAGEITYYINAQNRIAKISMGGTGAVTTYDYKDVSITVPAV